MRLTYTSDVWWKSAVVYCLDVETFKDGNGDGVGDFRGLTQQIDYLAGLGVTCLWLMPFFPTPNRDDGYDITDFYSVDPRLGTLGDFVEFMRTAHDRGLRVIADLVVNHTSDQHPWFAQARRSKDSPLLLPAPAGPERRQPRGQGRDRARHVLRLHRHAERLARTGPCGRTPARRRPARAPPAAEGLPVGDVPA
ncbi:alpha-amylase family glycosyl hydrolase [Nonomuraea sp. 10N515B]|uniref:alpha-amylase family glycosyl hydrolase n=1 Tax=Nonomuraea sp. 10N515B TaxID=3457422 RepID=UPI003FCCBCE3